jgi:hypothetical protein
VLDEQQLCRLDKDPRVFGRTLVWSYQMWREEEVL